MRILNLRIFLIGVKKHIFWWIHEPVLSTRTASVHSKASGSGIPLLNQSFSHPVILEQHDCDAYYRKKRSKEKKSTFRQTVKEKKRGKKAAL